MCGQWSEEGYIRRKIDSLKDELSLASWKHVVDQLASHGISSLLLRGGEIFLYPGIIELLGYIHSKGIFISIDTNGTMLTQYAEDINHIGNMHLTISVDGPEIIHDAVRCFPGAFKRIKEGVARLVELEKKCGNKIFSQTARRISASISSIILLEMSEKPASRHCGTGNEPSASVSTGANMP